MVIFAIVCCHGNNLQDTHMNEKEVSGVLLIFTVNARSLDPKLKKNSSFLTVHPSSGVHTVNPVGRQAPKAKEYFCDGKPFETCLESL